MPLFSPSLNKAIVPFSKQMTDSNPKKRRKDETEPKINTELQEIIKSTARLTLSNTASIRNIKAQVQATILIPSASIFVTAGKNATRAWSETKSSELPRPPPYCMVFQALLEVLVAHKDCNSVVAEFVQKWCSQVTDISEIALAVRQCRLSKCFDAKFTRLEISVGPELERVHKELIRILVHEGGRVCFGPGPRLPLERQLQASLGSLQ